MNIEIPVVMVILALAVIYTLGRNEWVCAIRRYWIQSDYEAYANVPAYERMLYRYWWDWRDDIKSWENRE